MKHFKGFAVKFIATFVLLYITLGILYGMTFGNVFVITLILGIISYIVGDILILSRTNNIVATLSDFGLAFSIIWIMGANLTTGDNLITATLISAIGVALIEYYFHRYFSKHILTMEEKRAPRTSLQFQTEASEELTPVRPDVRSTEDEK